MRFLLVEDEPSAARLIAKGLQEQEYLVDVVRDGWSASERLAASEYDAVVLDIMLPRKDGIAVCRDLRAAGSAVPVLMLTARDAVEARVEGLDSGADDYLTKPFDFRELVARLRALVRRGAAPLQPERLIFGGIEVDTRTHEVMKDRHPVVVTAREYALLEYLCRRPGELVTRHEIAARVWNDPWDLASNVIDVYIQRLRRKIDDNTRASMIRTRRGEGYQFIPPGVG